MEALELGLKKFEGTFNLKPEVNGELLGRRLLERGDSLSVAAVKATGCSVSTGTRINIIADKVIQNGRNRN